MKCLEKDRARRYETANGLAADLKRHLNNEPVVARPPSTAYRLQKAMRRNKLAFMAGAVVAAAVLAGTGISAWQAVVASRARAQQRLAAQQEAQRARKLRKRRGMRGRTRSLYAAEHEPGPAGLGPEQHRSAAAIAGRDPRLSRIAVLNGIIGSRKLTWP